MSCSYQARHVDLPAQRRECVRKILVEVVEFAMDVLTAFGNGIGERAAPIHSEQAACVSDNGNKDGH